MKTIILYGNLRKQFGKQFRLNVNSTTEAIRAMCKLVKGFETYLIEHNSPGFHIKVGKQYVDKDTIQEPSGESVIRISPYIVGSKGALKVIVGIAIIVAAVQTGGITAGAFALTKEAMLSFGLSLVLGGISEALFSPPKPPDSASREQADARPSYAFDGPVNTVQQGNPVPICYGELLVGSQVISAVTIARDI